jgi:hypothetical protein
MIQVLRLDTGDGDFSDFLRKLGRKALLKILQNKNEGVPIDLVPDQESCVLFVLVHYFAAAPSHTAAERPSSDTA